MAHDSPAYSRGERVGVIHRENGNEELFPKDNSHPPFIIISI